MDESNGMSFGETLRMFRERQHPKISQQKLAKALGLDRQTIVAWERGDYLPKDRTRVMELAEKLHLSESETDVLLKAALFDPPLWHIPYHRNPFFTGREESLQYLHEVLILGKTATLTQSQAISGLGGIGKTQIAIEYVYRFRGDYHAIVWLQADTYSILLSECANLAQVLNLPEKDESDQSIILRAVKRWFRSHSRWLLILDNLQDLGLVNEILPTGHRGSVLITTRSPVAEPFAHAYQLDVMSESEGILFLLRRIKDPSPKVPLDQTTEGQYFAARQLCELMGGLPLALDQAGAYILETGCGLSTYLHLYQQQRAELLARRGKFISGHEEAVTTTFLLCCEAIEKKNPTAVDFLRLCAFFHSEAIPEELLIAGAPSIALQAQAVANDPIAFNEALAQLYAYSLIQRNAQVKTLSVHRLVQAVLRDVMEKSVREGWAARCVGAIYEVLPTIEPEYLTARQQWKRYLSHALECVMLLDQESISVPSALVLLIKLGSYLRAHLRYTEAETLLRRALGLTEQIPFKKEDFRAECLMCLALLYQEMGKYDEAETVYQQLQQLGVQPIASFEDFADVLKVSDDIVNTSNQHEDFQEEEQVSLHEPIELINAQKAREGHPLWSAEDLKIAMFLNIRADFYRRQGKYQEAETLLQQALTIAEKHKTIQSGDLAMLLNNLAEIYREQEKFAEAEPLYLRALAIRKLGDSPVEMVQQLSNLGMLYLEQEKYEKAISTFEHALTLSDQVIDPLHPIKATLLHNFGAACYGWGNYQEAEKALKRAFYIRYLRLGPQHPETIETLGYYALVIAKEKQIDLGDPTKKEETTEILTSHLSYNLLMSIPEELSHIPEAVLALNIGKAYHRTAQYNEALQYYQQALSELSGGSGKVDEARIFNSIALTYIRQGKHQTALQLMQQAISTFTTSDDKVYLASALNNMGMATKDKDPQEALHYYEQALSLIHATGKRVELPNILNNMGEVYLNMNQLMEALALFKEALSIVDETDHPGLQECKGRILSNMAVTYDRGGYLQEALHFNQLSLLIRRSIGDRIGEIVTLNNVALLLEELDRIEEAVEILEQIVLVAQQVEGPGVQSAALANLAVLLYRYTDRKKEAIEYINQAITILEQTELTKNAAGTSLDDLRDFLRRM